MEIIKIIRNTVVAGKAVNAGDIIEASAADEKLLIGIGKAAPASDKEVKAFLKAKAEAEKGGGDPPAGPDAGGQGPDGDKK